MVADPFFEGEVQVKTPGAPVPLWPADDLTAPGEARQIIITADEDNAGPIRVRSAEFAITRTSPDTTRRGLPKLNGGWSVKLTAHDGAVIPMNAFLIDADTADDKARWFAERIHHRCPSPSACAGIDIEFIGPQGLGSGDVLGPASASDNAIVRFSGTGGKAIQGSGVQISNSDVLTLGNDLNLNNHPIVSAAARDIEIIPGTTGNLVLDGQKWPRDTAAGSSKQFLQTDAAGQTAWANPPFDQPPYISGVTYLTIPGVESTDLTIVVDRLYGGYFQVTAPSQAFDRVSFEVKVAQAAKNARLGLFNVGTNGLPGSLVTDFGTISVATTGGKEITISETLSYGWYVLGIVTDATTCDIEQISNVGHRRLGSHVSGGALSGHVYVAHAYGALPDPFGAPTYTTVAREPRLGLRVA